MADAVISVAVERAAAILEDQIGYEVNLLRGVEDGVKDLSGKLGTIRTVLDDADKRGVKEPSVKQWLKKLEDAAYEMEDILDEWHYALVNHKIANQKVPCCSSIPSLSSCLCFKKVGVRHTIGIKIQDVKAKLDQILIEKEQFNFVPSLLPSDVEPKPLRDQSTSSIDQAKVHGLDIHKNKNEIVGRLIDDSSSELLSIVGMGGLGKTTLAQLVFNDTQVKNSFDLTIWICVSRPFDTAKIAREIVESVGTQTIPPNTSQLELVLDKLRKSISGKKFLLVLDDVWIKNDVWIKTSKEWETLKINLIDCATSSKILVTSREPTVAMMMGSSDRQIYYPEHLSNEECWSLLRSIALPRKSEEECREFKGVGMKITVKCKGLPLAAIVLGSLLQSKDLKGWGNVLESEIWQLEEAKEGLFPPLLLTYNELSLALKRCFSYCAVYPKDSYINVERLIQEWMAIGYLGSGSVRGNSELEVKGRNYFNSLAMRSLFQDIKKRDDGSIYQCKMHDIVHDFAMSLRKNDDAATMTKNSCQVCDPILVSQVQEYRSLSLVLDEESPMNVCDCLASVRVLRVKLCFPLGMKKLIHLRSLELSRNRLSEEDLKIICRFYFLQTLLVSDCDLEKIPIEIGNLVELRHLNLCFNKKLKELPESVCSLVELRILNLEDCRNLQVLPKGIDRLRNLQCLLIEDTPANHHLPRGVGELSGLYSLGTKDESDFHTKFYGGRGCNELGMLKKLNNLTGSLKLEIKISSDAEELVKDAQEADLKSKIYINTLYIEFAKSEVKQSSPLWMELMEALEPNQKKLKELKIKRYMGSRLPQWISSPHSSLKKMYLVNGFCELSPLPPLGRLPSLEFLKIKWMRELKYVGRELLGIESPSPSSSSSSTTTKEVVAFPKLKELHISSCWEWLEWEDITEEEEESAAVSVMPCLEELRISSCGSLKKLPYRLLRKASSSLQLLDIEDSWLLERQYVDKEGSEWRSISQYNPHLQLLLNGVDSDDD